MNAPALSEGLARADREKRFVAFTSVLAAVFLTGMKVAVGVSTGSIGILAEAAHSALDLVDAVPEGLRERLVVAARLPGVVDVPRLPGRRGSSRRRGSWRRGTASAPTPSARTARGRGSRWSSTSRRTSG